MAVCLTLTEMMKIIAHQKGDEAPVLMSKFKQLCDEAAAEICAVHNSANPSQRIAFDNIHVQSSLEDYGDALMAFVPEDGMVFDDVPAIIQGYDDDGWVK